MKPICQGIKFQFVLTINTGIFSSLRVFLRHTVKNSRFSRSFWRTRKLCYVFSFCDDSNLRMCALK